MEFSNFTEQYLEKLQCGSWKNHFLPSDEFYTILDYFRDYHILIGKVGFGQYTFWKNSKNSSFVLKISMFRMDGQQNPERFMLLLYKISKFQF